MRVVVVGAGMGGLSAAIALEQQGHEIVIVERSGAVAKGGVGIAVGPNALVALARLGAARDVLDRGNTASGRRVYDWTGRKLSEGPWRGGVVRRADLYAALSGRIRGDVRYGHTCVGVDQDKRGAVVRSTTARQKPPMSSSRQTDCARRSVGNSSRTETRSIAARPRSGCCADHTPSDRESHHRELGSRPPGRVAESRTRLDVLVHRLERTTGVVRTGGGGEADASRPLSRLA